MQERLSVWGQCIYAQRRRQRIKGADFCARLGISRTTLNRQPSLRQPPEAQRGGWRYRCVNAGSGSEVGAVIAVPACDMQSLH